MARFRLATLERLREQHEQTCARALRDSTEALSAARQRREDLIAQLNTGDTVLTADQLVRGALFRDRLRAEISISTTEINHCTVLFDQARTAWMQATAQLKAVQSLHDRHRRAVRAALARAEQAELDEFAGTRNRRPAIGGAA